MWEVFLFNVTTGNVGPRLEPESLEWNVDLNDIESIEIKLRKSNLPTGLDLNYWLSPWWAGVLLRYNGTPIVAGPILARPNETPLTVSLSCGGIRSVLLRRYVVEEQSNWAKLSKSVIKYKGLSLGTIAKRVVQKVLDKPYGSLPINYPLPDEIITNDAKHERTYKGFNVQNISCHDVLTKLSNVIGGPDIMFKPRMISDSRFTFDMWYGSENDPKIPQTIMPVWDTTADDSDISGLALIYTGTYLRSRVFSLGAGQDEGVIIKVAQSMELPAKGYPLLESAINYSNSEHPEVVLQHAQSNLRSNTEPLKEFQLEVYAGQESTFPIGTFWPGDYAKVYIKGWIGVPDGAHLMKILAMNGTGSDRVKMNLQLVSQYNTREIDNVDT